MTLIPIQPLMLKVDNVTVITNPVNMLNNGTWWHWNFECDYNVFT